MEREYPLKCNPSAKDSENTSFRLISLREAVDSFSQNPYMRESGIQNSVESAQRRRNLSLPNHLADLRNIWSE
jgi:hypothetical protein